MTLLDAELHQRFGCGRLLLRGHGEELPHELRCLALPIHGLHLKGVASSSSDCASGARGVGAGGG